MSENASVHHLKVDSITHIVMAMLLCVPRCTIKKLTFIRGHSKIKTLDKLMKLTKPLYPRAHINYLTGKIGSLRSPYNGEHNLVQDSKRSGTAANDI